MNQRSDSLHQRPNASPESPSAPPAWSSLGSMPFSGDAPRAFRGNTPQQSANNPAEAERESEKREKSRLRQEEKLIAIFARNDSDLLEARSISVSDDERASVLADLSDGKIGPEEESAILREIVSPVHNPDVGPDGVFERLSSRQEKRILADFGGLDFYHPEETTPETVAALVSKYPTPVEFEKAEANFLEDIRQNNSDKKYREYLSAMTEFKTKVYGKREEYHEAFESLSARANAFRPTSEAEKRDFLETCQVEGDAFLLDDKEYCLTPKTLESLGLAPEYVYKIEDAKIGLSKAYEIADGRLAVNAYVKTPRGGVVCSYYRSKNPVSLSPPS